MFFFIQGKLDKEIGDEEVEVVKDDDVSSKVFHGQMPFFVPVSLCIFLSKINFSH